MFEQQSFVSYIPKHSSGNHLVVSVPTSFSGAIQTQLFLDYPLYFTVLGSVDGSHGGAAEVLSPSLPLILCKRELSYHGSPPSVFASTRMNGPMYE